MTWHQSTWNSEFIAGTSSFNLMFESQSRTSSCCKQLFVDQIITNTKKSFTILSCYIFYYPPKQNIQIANRFHCSTWKLSSHINIFLERERESSSQFIQQVIWKFARAWSEVRFAHQHMSFVASHDNGGLDEALSHSAWYVCHCMLYQRVRIPISWLSPTLNHSPLMFHSKGKIKQPSMISTQLTHYAL